jgi:hypothetical protein
VYPIPRRRSSLTTVGVDLRASGPCLGSTEAGRAPVAMTMPRAARRGPEAAWSVGIRESSASTCGGVTHRGGCWKIVSLRAAVGGLLRRRRATSTSRSSWTSAAWTRCAHGNRQSHVRTPVSFAAVHVHLHDQMQKRLHNHRNTRWDREAEHYPSRIVAVVAGMALRHPFVRRLLIPDLTKLHANSTASGVTAWPIESPDEMVSAWINPL